MSTELLVEIGSGILMGSLCAAAIAAPRYSKKSAIWTWVFNCMLFGIAFVWFELMQQHYPNGSVHKEYFLISCVLMISVCVYLILRFGPRLKMTTPKGWEERGPKYQITDQARVLFKQGKKLDALKEVVASNPGIPGQDANYILFTLLDQELSI